MLDPLDKDIWRVLSSKSNMSAEDVAREIGVPRQEVSSRLYHGRGRLYEISGDAPPLWRLQEGRPRHGCSHNHPEAIVRTSDKVHVDFAGGDWELTIVVRRASRNDPIGLVEITGPRQRVVIVSDYVIPGGLAATTSGPLHPAALVVAASMLGWEIANHMAETVHGSQFDFGCAVRDIYLSLIAHARKMGTD